MVLTETCRNNDKIVTTVAMKKHDEGLRIEFG